MQMKYLRAGAWIVCMIIFVAKLSHENAGGHTCIIRIIHTATLWYSCVMINSSTSQAIFIVEDHLQTTRFKAIKQ